MNKSLSCQLLLFLRTATLSFLLFVLALISPCFGTDSVGQWDRFEATIKNNNTYNNPYKDVTLNVTYTSPTGDRTNFWGFYDGDKTWKIRFMPDRLGTWKYSASFSDGSPGAEGSFECLPSDIPGMISQDQTNPIWFGYKSGAHFQVRSFHVGDRFFAENWPAENRKAFLDWAQTQNYNMLSVASHYLNRNAKSRGLSWKTPDLWPLNAAEFRKLETILNDLAERKIAVYPFAGFFGQSSNFPTNHQDQQLYIRYTLARIAPYWNILFNVAGPEPTIKANQFQNAMTPKDINRLGSLIHKLDPFGHPISIHNPGGDDPYINAPWQSYGTLQGWKDANLISINKGLLKNHHPAKPLYAQEVFWPGNMYHKIKTDTEIRKKAYVMLLSAAAINYADMNGNSSTGFSGSMNLAEKVQSRHDIIKKVWDFFETIPFYKMTPSQELIDNGFCLAEQGRTYLIYLPDAGKVNVTIERGTYNITWINAQNTTDRKNAGTTTDGKNLTTPAYADDWLLYLSRKDRAK